MNKKIIHLITIALFGIVAISYAQTSVNNISPDNIIGGIGQKLTISGSGFGNLQGINFVSFIQESGNYLDATQGRALKYISWVNTKIEVEMPCAFSGKIHVNIGGIDYISNDTLKVKASLGYITANPLDYVYLTNQNSKGGYTWYIHRLYWENPAAKAVIEDVFKEFRCKTGVNYILASAPSDAPLTLADSINLIAPDSVLGAAGYMDLLWSSCILGPTTFYQAKSMDIRMSTKLNWYFGNGQVPNGKAKFRYVLMHELGHSLGLKHVNEIGQTMYPSVTDLPSNNWSERDSIATEEKLAISYFVKLSQDFTFRACGINPLSKITNCEDVYGLTSDIENTYNERKFNIFPNPSNGIFFIENNSKGLNEIQIFNALGKMVYQTTVNMQSSQNIDLSKQPAGIYFVLIIEDKQTSYNQKIIITK